MLLSELCKNLLSIVFLSWEYSTKPSVLVTVHWTGLRYAVPALLYALHNNIIFVALRLINPVTYQLFNNASYHFSCLKCPHHKHLPAFEGTACHVCTIPHSIGGFFLK